MTFYTLNYNEQVMYLKAYAERALSAWEITWHTIKLTSYENNAVFRVEDAHFVYGLRIYRPNTKPRDMIVSEGAWLNTMPDDVQVPRWCRPLYKGELHGIDTSVFAAIWHWIEGDFIYPADLTTVQAGQIGAFLAKMHNAAIHADDTLSSRPRLDYEGLFGERSPYHSQNESEYITKSSQAVLDAVATQVQQVMYKMDSDENAFGLIHGDFIYKNTLFTPEGDIAAIDFDDCGFGYYLYDIACPLLFYKPLPNYDTLKDALWRGYNAVRPLPEHYRDHLETLVAGRYVASCLWVAGNAENPNIKGKVKQIIGGRVQELQTYLDTGKL